MKLFKSVAIFAILFLPQLGFAYSVTDASVTSLGDNAALYIIKYQFGLGAYDTQAPIGVSFGSSKSPYLTYQFMNDNAELTADEVGQVSGIILSDAEVSDATYAVPEGQNKAFTLVVLRTIANGAINTDDYLQITSLPFSLSRNGESLPTGQLGNQALALSRTP